MPPTTVGARLPIAAAVASSGTSTTSQLFSGPHGIRPTVASDRDNLRLLSRSKWGRSLWTSRTSGNPPLLMCTSRDLRNPATMFSWGSYKGRPRTSLPDSTFRQDRPDSLTGHWGSPSVAVRLKGGLSIFLRTHWTKADRFLPRSSLTLSECVGADALVFVAPLKEVEK